MLGHPALYHDNGTSGGLRSFLGGQSGLSWIHLGSLLHHPAHQYHETGAPGGLESLPGNRFWQYLTNIPATTYLFAH